MNSQHTVSLTSTGNSVSGNQEFCLAPSKTMVEQVKKIRIFPVGEKLIAPGMQHIEYAVIHKTRRSKRELHN
jgi:hypothetical protein